MKLKLYNPSGHYKSKTVCTIISPSLCAPVLLGLPFLKHNGIIVDTNAHTAIDKFHSFNLLNPVLPKPTSPLKPKDKFNYELHNTILKFQKAVINEMKTSFTSKQKLNVFQTMGKYA